MDATDTTAPASRARWAVAAAFFINGFITGSWAPQIPLLLTRLEISEFVLGLLILVFGLGALTAMPFSGYLMTKRGSRPVVIGFAWIVVFALLLVVLSPNVWVAAVTMFIFGGSIGAMDVAMNANAVVVERKLSRAIMSSSHGFWSLGGFAGGGLGGIFILSFGHLPHAMFVTVAAAAMTAFALPHLIGEDKPVAHEHHHFRLPRLPTIYLVGIMALFSMIPEGAVLDWAALYLKQELGADIATAGFAFAAFSGIMALMRFLGDGVRNRFGAVTTLRVSALIAACGMLAAGLAPNPWVAIAAFAFCGLGVANMVPIAFSAAGNQPGVPSNIGMSVVTTMGYSGILVAPSGIGFVAGHVGFAPVFVTLSGFLVVVCLMAGLARHADFRAMPQTAPAE
ncbi:Inner membrane protein YbjJ [Aminobacter sp. MSH1]|uniref:MFS transporter n=1 Tax=Aminobacter sp. MSH1 TaxID=374606 RepID=UPI000D3A5BE6|nr:MFS transporter [Aminobacter sp. MSH1]AWC21850.1 Inner membrane protein YbjJ [Aminobacter sp. MSH1]